MILEWTAVLLLTDAGVLYHHLLGVDAIAAWGVVLFSVAASLIEGWGWVVGDEHLLLLHL